VLQAIQDSHEHVVDLREKTGFYSNPKNQCFIERVV